MKPGLSAQFAMQIRSVLPQQRPLRVVYPAQLRP
jgi:hypothetical protein